MKKESWRRGGERELKEPQKPSQRAHKPPTTTHNLDAGIKRSVCEVGVKQRERREELREKNWGWRDVRDAKGLQLCKRTRPLLSFSN